MRILFNDLLQHSNAPGELKSPALTENFFLDGNLHISFNEPIVFDCVGIGGCDAKELKIALLSYVEPENTVDGGCPKTEQISQYMDGGFPDIAEAKLLDAIDGGIFGYHDVQPNIKYIGSGLYMLPREYSVRTLRVSLEGGTRIGRLAFGRAFDIPTTPAKELSYASTATEQLSVSGQLIPGAGGYGYRTLSLDSRYKLGPEALREIEAGYKIIGKGYPFFMDLESDVYKLPFSKFYGIERSQKNWVFQGGVTRFKYSMKFNFEECF